MPDLLSQYREHIRYDPDTGYFWWIKPAKKRRLDRPAGCVSKDTGYRLICLFGKLVRAHRLAWLFMTGEWPDTDVDHENRNRDDNRWSNLRLATRTQNNANSKRPKTNTSGYKGVFWHKNYRKWVARIQINGKGMYLGARDDPEEAHKLYVAAANKYFGHFARVA